MPALSREEIRAKYKNDQNWPIQSFDAQDWASAFMKNLSQHNGHVTEDLMIGWFAAALMRGFDERASSPARHTHTEGLTEEEAKLVNVLRSQVEAIHTIDSDLVAQALAIIHRITTEERK